MIMLWLLNLIPNFTIHFVLVASILALLATQFFSFIPFVGKYLDPLGEMAAEGVDTFALGNIGENIDL